MNRLQSGVCAACAHARWLKSGGGGDIVLCRRSETDPRFLKFPGLPVLSCPGWAPPKDVA